MKRRPEMRVLWIDSWTQTGNGASEENGGNGIKTENCRSRLKATQVTHTHTHPKVMVVNNRTGHSIGGKGRLFLKRLKEELIYLNRQE
jgi:hypothetical protein